jgi:signal transduction histidine kinase
MAWHGGRLIIENVPEQGATFTVHLPATRSWR